MTLQYRGIIFDLDGTLYDTSALDDANLIAMQNAVGEGLRISLRDADAILKANLRRVSAGGVRSSLYSAALATGTPDSVIAKWQERELQPEKELDLDTELAGLLTSLSCHTHLALITNTRTSIAERALSALGIELAIFTVLRGGDKLKRPKPSPEDLLETVDIFAALPSQCVSVGDRWDVDLQPAADIGMAVQLVLGRDHLCVKLREWLTQL